MRKQTRKFFTAEAASCRLPGLMTTRQYWPLSYLLILLTALTQSFATSTAEIRVIGQIAITYTEFLPKAEFDQRFPGEIKSDLTDLEEGWYVVYEHESLNYYFGPIMLKAMGEDYLAQLTQIVAAAVEQRPSIEGYRLELLFEPSAALPIDADEDEDVSDEELPDLTVQKKGFWTRVRGFFGF